MSAGLYSAGDVYTKIRDKEVLIAKQFIADDLALIFSKGEIKQLRDTTNKVIGTDFLNKGFCGFYRPEMDCGSDNYRHITNIVSELTVNRKDYDQFVLRSGNGKKRNQEGYLEKAYRFIRIENEFKLIGYEMSNYDQFGMR